MKTADENANVLGVDFFQKAYKKLKSSAYYDKTNLYLRDRIAQAESEADIDDTLEELCDALQSDSWDNYAADILSTSCNHLKVMAAQRTKAVMNFTAGTTFCFLSIAAMNLHQLWIDPCSSLLRTL